MKLKKLLALMLAAVMVFSLAACSSSSSDEETTAEESAEAEAEEDTSADTAEDTSASSDGVTLPDEYAGKSCIQLLPSASATGLVAIMDAMAEVLAEYGIETEQKDCNGDTANYITYAENAVTSGDCAILMIAADDTEAIEEACQTAMDAGIIVLMLGASPDYEIDNMVITSYALTGYYAVKTAEDWVAYCEEAGIELTTNDEGKVAVAINTRYDDQQGAKRSDAFVGEVEASDVLYEVNENDFYDDAQTEGYTWAEQVMTSNPETRIFLCYEPDAMKGVSEYVEEYCDNNGLSYDEFAVFWCYEDDDSNEMYAAACADYSSTVLKGYCTYGAGNDVTGQTLAQLALGRINYESDFGYEYSYEFGYQYVDVVNAYGTWDGGVSLYSWVDGDDNPAEAYE